MNCTRSRDMMCEQLHSFVTKYFAKDPNLAPHLKQLRIKSFQNDLLVFSLPAFNFTKMFEGKCDIS